MGVQNYENLPFLLTAEQWVAITLHNSGNVTLQKAAVETLAVAAVNLGLWSASEKTAQALTRLFLLTAMPRHVAAEMTAPQQRNLMHTIKKGLNLHGTRAGQLVEYINFLPITPLLLQQQHPQLCATVYAHGKLQFLPL